MFLIFKQDEHIRNITITITFLPCVYINFPFPCLPVTQHGLLFVSTNVGRHQHKNQLLITAIRRGPPPVYMDLKFPRRRMKYLCNTFSGATSSKYADIFMFCPPQNQIPFIKSFSPRLMEDEAAVRDLVSRSSGM